MDAQYIMTVGRESFMTVLIIAAPAMIIGLIVGVIMAIFQAVTSVQEQTLTMIPKMMAVGLTLLITLPWILATLVAFSERIFVAIKDAAR